MKSSTSPEFWRAYAKLSPSARAAARKAYRLWRENPRHGSLQFQKRGRFWRACFGDGHRALAVAVPDGYLWFWIGTHDEYERLLKDNGPCSAPFRCPHPRDFTRGAPDDVGGA